MQLHTEILNVLMIRIPLKQQTQALSSTRFIQHYLWNCGVLMILALTCKGMQQL